MGVVLAILGRYWKQIALVVLVLGVIAWGAVWHHGKVKGVFNEGYAKAEAELRPQLEACEVGRATAIDANKEMVQTIARLELLSKSQKQAIEDLSQREMAAKLRGDRIMAELAKKEKELRIAIDRLRVQLEVPSPTPAEACRVADQILTDLARRSE